MFQADRHRPDRPESEGTWTMSTWTELTTEIAIGEMRLAGLANELHQAAGLQKSAVLKEISQVAIDLNGLVHAQHAQGWSSES